MTKPARKAKRPSVPAARKKRRTRVELDAAELDEMRRLWNQEPYVSTQRVRRHTDIEWDGPRIDVILADE